MHVLAFYGYGINFTPLAALLVPLAVMAFFWGVQVFDLMRRPDSDFPGRFDKLLWIAILLFTFILGALVYYVYSLSYHGKPEDQAQAPPRPRRL